MKRAAATVIGGILTFAQTIGLALKTVNSIVAYKQTKAMLKAMEVIQSNQDLYDGLHRSHRKRNSCYCQNDTPQFERHEQVNGHL